MTKVAAIETKGLCIGYLLKGGKRKVVHEDLNLQLVSGEVTCLLGLNGAGKSSCFVRFVVFNFHSEGKYV